MNNISLVRLIESENLNVYKVDAVLRVKQSVQISDIYNKIRAIKNIVTVRAIDHKQIGSVQRATISIKFIADTNTQLVVKQIISQVQSIEGIILFKMLPETATTL